jgi:hypothetical protein
MFHTGAHQYYWISVLTLFLVFVSGSIICFSTSYNTYAALRINQQNFHPNTQALYRRLLIILIVDLSLSEFVIKLNHFNSLNLAICVAAVPFFLVAGGTAINVENISMSITVACLIPEVYPLLVNSILILYIKPYRMGAFQLMKQIGCKCLKRNVVYVKTTVVSQSNH